MANSQPTAPRLETSRLVLDAHRASDLAASAAIWADPAVVRHIGGTVQTAEETWGRLLRYAGLWPMVGFGYWAIRDRESDQFLGDIGLADFHRSITPDQGSDPEIGWALATAAHGRGYASEAVAAVIAWADTVLDAGRTWCLIDPANHASIAVATKAGYAPRGTATYRGRETRLFDRSKPAS